MARLKRWYELALKTQVVEDLNSHPGIVKELGSYKDKFINWCAIQRVSYEPNIVEEYLEFEKEIMKNRLYDKDIRLWKRISNEVFKRDNYICAYCNQRGGKLEVDHIVPISKGGSNHISNLTTSCQRCNRQKKDKTVDEFLQWRGMT